MATDAEKFVQQMRTQVEKASGHLGDIQSALAQDSELHRFVAGLQASRKRILQELEALPLDQPVEASKKRDVRQKVAALTRRAARVDEGIEFAVDPRPPKVTAWIWFGVELLAVVLVALFYVNLHQGRPLRVFLRSVPPASRVELALQLADLKTLAVAEKPDLAALGGVLDGVEAGFEEANFAPEDKTVFDESVAHIRTELSRGDEMNGEVVGVYADRIVNAVLKAEDPFFWDRGVGRYVEVLFAVFFGVMAFALYNNWQYMRSPGRSWWIAWHIAKIFMALVLGFVTIAILSQVNFATPSSLEKQTALGLGLAPIELVIAISALAGYFSSRMVGFLDRYADRVFGQSIP